jgi:hypothetical protein
MVPDNVIVSFLCEELDRETSNIANSIGAALLTTSGTETEENLGLLASGVEELGASQLSNLGVGDFEFSPGTSSLGVDDSFRNALSAEVSQSLEEKCITKSCETAAAKDWKGSAH